MTHKTLPLFVTLLAGAVIVLLWALRNVGTSLDLGPLPGMEASAPFEPAGFEFEPLEASLVDAEVDVESYRVRPNPEESVAGPLIEPRKLLVLVVDRASGTPVVGARVRSAPLRELRSRRERRISPDPEEDLAQAGVETRTDEQGGATVILSELPASIDARVGERWGHRRIETGVLEPIRIEISLDRSVNVQTIDAAGRPLADVPVVVRSQRERGEARELWANRTRGEQGLAVVPHFDTLLDERGAEGDLTVGLGFLTRELSFEPIDLDALPTNPIRIVVPATGSLSIRVEDPTGEPVRRALVRIALAQEGAADAVELGSKRADKTRVRLDGRPEAPSGRGATVRRLQVLEGRAIEPIVEVGLALVVEAQSDEGWKPVSIRAAGPRGAGENAEIVLRFGASFPRLTGRLVDEQGVALARRNVRAKVIDRDLAPSRAPAKPLERLWTSTDENGSFQLVLDPVPQPDAVEMEFGVLDDARSPALLARVALPAILSDASIALGDIVAHGAPTLLDGIVVDQVGDPVAGARIDVEHELEVGTGRSGKRWRRDIDLASKTDDGGRFVIRGSSELGLLRLSAARAGFARADPVTAQPGDRELRLVLERSGDVAGRLALDPGIAPERFSIRVRRTTASGAVASPWSAPVQRDGSFWVGAIQPGVVDVAVLFGQDPAPIAEVTGVVVTGNAVARDPRLDPLDLRGRARILRIDAVDADHRPVVLGKVFVTAQKPASSAVFELADGRVLVPLHGTSVEIAIRAPGYRELHLAGVDGDRSVELETAIVVRLRLAAGVRLPDAPARLAVTLTPVGAPAPARTKFGSDRPARRRAASGSSQASALFGAEGEAQVELSAPGAYRVRFDLRAERVRFPPLEGVPPTIEPADAAGQVFVIAPEAAPYEQALRGLR